MADRRKKMNNIMNIERLTALDKYVIPIYQRDFSWTDFELYRFIFDIENARKNGREEYYIGSLVVFAKEDGSYEVVDGQQRLTALCILLALNDDRNINLHFEARKKSEKALSHLNGKGDHVFCISYRRMQCYLEQIDNKDGFFNYLKKNVFLIRVELDKTIDLNHYFELMNSRARQCEMSDVVKSYLKNFLLDKKERDVLDVAWEGISSFDGFLEQKIAQRLWNRMLYGDGWAPLVDVDFALWWKMIVSHVEGDDDVFYGGLDEAICSNVESYIRPKAKIGMDVKHRSLIDFEQFILISTEIIYDIKLPKGIDIVQAFEQLKLFKNSDDVKKYIHSILIIRHLFDIYFIKNIDSSFVLMKYVDVNEFVPVFGDLNKSIVHVEKKHAYKMDSNWIESILRHLVSNPHQNGKEFLLFLKSI